MSKQFWTQTVLLMDMLNEHAPLKQEVLKDDHVLLMKS